MTSTKKKSRQGRGSNPILHPTVPHPHEVPMSLLIFLRSKGQDASDISCTGGALRTSDGKMSPAQWERF
eukprot:10632029-Karenia_brevis.AAC.1